MQRILDIHPVIDSQMPMVSRYEFRHRDLLSTATGKAVETILKNYEVFKVEKAGLCPDPSFARKAGKGTEFLSAAIG